MSQRQIHPATGSQSVSMAPRKSMVATPLTNFGSPGQRRNSKENLGIIPFPSGEKDQEGALRASGQSLKAGMMSAPDVFAAGGGGTEKRNSRESQQGQPAAAQNVRSHRRSSTIESSTGEQLIVAPEEEKYEMRGLLINVFISVLLGVLIGVCGAMFHNAVHMMKIFFRVTLGNLMVDWFDSDPYIFAHMWLGATACIMAVSFITRHMCPECIGGGMVATKICICLSSPIQLQIIAYRFVLSAIYIGGGSPLGIEAPTFHLSAAIASNANRFIEKLDNTILNADTMPQIVLIGCVAGLSQAFNTPIGSLLFVLEEFDFVRRSHITFVMIVACSVPATAVSLYLKKSFNLHSSFLALPPPENLASNDVSLLLLYVYAALIGAITAMFSEMFSEMVLRFRSRFASFVSSFETDDHDENGSKLDGAPGDQEDPQQQQPSSSFTEEQARRFSLDTSDDFFKSDSGSATASGFHPASAVDRLSEQGGKPRNSQGGSSSTPTGATPPSSGNTAPAAGQGQGQLLPNQANIPGQMSASSSPTTGHQQLPNQHSHESSIPSLSGGGGGAAAAAGAAAADQKQSSAKGPTSVASTLTGQSSNANAPLNHRSTVLQDPQNIVHGQILVASIKNNARKLFHFDKLKPTEKGYFLLNIAAGSVVGLSGILVYNVMRLQINVHCEQWKKSCPDAWGSGEQLLEYLHRKAHQAANRDELDYTTAGAGGATALVRRHLGAASVGAKGELATAGAGGHSSDSQSGLELIGRSYDEEDFPSDRENDVAVTTLAGGGMQVRSTSRTDPGSMRAEMYSGESFSAARLHDLGSSASSDNNLAQKLPSASTYSSSTSTTTSERTSAEKSSASSTFSSTSSSRSRSSSSSFSTSSSSSPSQRGSSTSSHEILPGREHHDTGRRSFVSSSSSGSGPFEGVEDLNNADGEEAGRGQDTARLPQSRPASSSSGTWAATADLIVEQYQLKGATDESRRSSRHHQKSPFLRSRNADAPPGDNSHSDGFSVRHKSPSIFRDEIIGGAIEGAADGGDGDLGDTVLRSESSTSYGGQKRSLGAGQKKQGNESGVAGRWGELLSTLPSPVLEDGMIGIGNKGIDLHGSTLLTDEISLAGEEGRAAPEQDETLFERFRRHLGGSSFVDYGPISIGGMACTYFVVGFLKMFAVAVCTAAGGSGGMFAPAMIMGGYFGGGLGSLLKWASGPEDPVNGTYLQLCVLFGMVGFFSASHRLPLTGSLCIYELIVASTDEDKTIAGTYIVSRLFFPMLVCSIVSFCLSIYMHPQALLERTMEQDGLHDLCFGSGDMDGSDPWAIDEDGSDSDSDTESSTEEETADRDGAGTVEGGRQSGSSVKSNEQTNFMSMVSKTLLPPELMQAGKGRRQSVDLGLVFRKPLYETGSFAAAPKRENRQIERKQKTPSGSSAGAGSNSPAEDDINDGARGGSSTSGGGSVSGGGKRKPSVKTEDGTDYSEPVLMTDTERQKLKIRRASHPPTAEATNTNARIVEFYRRNSSDLRKEFEALKQSIANPPTSSSSKRSFVPDKNLLKTLHSEERRQNSSKEAPERLQSGAGHRGGGGTGDSASNQADSPPVVQRELSLGAPNFDDFLRPRQQPDDAISVSLSVHRGSAIPRNNWAPHDFGGTGSGGTMNLSSQGSKRNTQSVQPNSQTKRNTKVSSTSTLRILENAMKRRGNAAETASSLSSMTSNSTPDGMINLTNNSLSAMAGGGPGGSANMPRASAAFLRARSGSISTTPGQLWKELRESRAERGPPNLASTSEEDCMSSYQPVLSQRSIGGPKHSLSMTSLGSSQMALPTEIVYPSSVPEEEEN